jgi:hypothetical protein
VDINDLPELPADALEMLEQALARYGYNPNKLRHTAAAQEPRAERDRVDSSEASFRGLNQHAMDHFELWVPKLNLHKLGRTPGGYEAVADWRSSCSGRPLEQRKKNLKIHREGIKDFGADKTYSPIDLVMAAQNMGDCFQAFEWLAEVTDWVIDRSKVISPNFEANMKRKQAERESAKADEPAPDKAADPEPAPVVVEIPPWRLNTPSPAVVSLPDAELAQCTGFVGRVADWIVQTARVQQPEFAMAGALVLTATLAGRRVVGPTGAGLQLYAIMAGKSASGKGHANNAMQSLLKSAGLLQRLRIGNFASGASVFTAMIDSPLSYAFVDEAGKTLFGRGKGKNAASHEQQIHAYLRQFWSESPTSTCYTEERVAERARACHGAALSLLCASSPEELFASCDSMDVINGFLNRFVLFQARSRVYHTPSPADVNSPPEQLVEDAKAIYYCPDDMSSARFHGRGDTELVADPDRVPWANQEVEEAYNAMTRWAIDRVEEDPVNGELYGRVAEYAVRIATIRAVGNNWTSPAITLDDLAWARALVLRSFENMISAVSENMAENDYERNRNRIHGYLKRKKKAMEMRDIQRGMTGLSKKQIDEIIDRLKSEERIEEVDVTDPKRDTKRKIAYRAVG